MDERKTINLDHRQLLDAYLDQLWLEKGLSRNTLESYGRDLRFFAAWLETQGRGLLLADRSDLLNYLNHRSSIGVASRSVARGLSAIRSFYKYLLRENRIVEDPTLRIDNPKLGRKLPDTLSESEVDALLAAPNTASAVGYRDRTMLELLYATGLRVTELVTLEMNDLNLRQGVLRVMGKGGKERLVPMGDEAMAWVEGFVRDHRSSLMRRSESEAVLFPSNRGREMTRQALGFSSRCC